MDEDMILPEGFDDTPTAEPEVETQEMDSEGFDTEEVAEDTKPATDDVQVTEEPVQPQTIKIKYNHEERDISLDEAALLAQKGMNYEKAIERERQASRDAMIADMGYEWNGKPVKTEAEYKQAIAEQKLIEQYKDRDLPPELIEEIMAGRRDREERAKEREAQETQAKKDAEINEFLEYFQEVNERAFDPNKDAIPQEVKEAVDKGLPLMQAYMRYQNKQFRNQLKIAKQNETNTKRAPVTSVTAFGGTKTEPSDPFLEGFNSI